MSIIIKETNIACNDNQAVTKSVYNIYDISSSSRNDMQCIETSSDIELAPISIVARSILEIRVSQQTNKYNISYHAI